MFMKACHDKNEFFMIFACFGVLFLSVKIQEYIYIHISGIVCS